MSRSSRLLPSERHQKILNTAGLDFDVHGGAVTYEPPSSDIDRSTSKALSPLLSGLPGRQGKMKPEDSPASTAGTAESSADGRSNTSSQTQQEASTASTAPVAELVDNTGVAATAPAPSDTPALPPRDYPRDPRFLAYQAPTPPSFQSKQLPRFLKFVALSVFLTGSSVTLLTLLYRVRTVTYSIESVRADERALQRYVYPRLLITKTAVSSLHQAHLSSYDKLLLQLRAFVSGNETLFITSQKVSTVPKASESGAEGEKKDISAEEEKSMLLDDPVDTVEVPEEGEKTASRPLLDGPEEALLRLRDALRQHQPTHPTKDVSYLPDATPAQRLLKSFEVLSDKLTKETFAASQSSFPSSYPYGYGYGNSAAGAMNDRSGTDKEKIAQLKSDIRSLKGALLNRRNFAPAVRNS